jgi:hypothetical protein
VIVLGIDPGLSGAVAVIHGDAAGVWSVPVVEKQTGWRRNKAGERVPKTHTSIVVEKLARLIGEAVNVCEPQTESVAFVEWARSGPSMGVSSAFHYGEGFGMIRGILAHLGVPVRLVTADKWKRAMGLITKGSRELGRNDARDKAPAFELARKLYPRLAEQLALAKHEGRAEALLIAHYGCEVLEEKKAGPLFVPRRPRLVASPELEF